MADETAITEEILIDEGPVDSETVSTRTIVDIAALSDRGKLRPHNEDSFLVTRFERSLRTVLSNLPIDQAPPDHSEIGYAMLVADGMGGAAAGEVASRTAIAKLVDLAIQTPDWILRLNGRRAERVLRRMEERFESLRAALAKRVDADPSLAGMGTTMTMAISLGRDLIISHVGDSRVYLYTYGHLLPLTKDQTMAQLLADAGVIDPGDVGKHYARHVLTGAITADGAKADVELRHLLLADGDQLLLCSDGLTEMVSDKEIAAVLKQNKPADKACHELIDLALQAGGKDNVTVIVARYQIPSDRGDTHW